MMMLITVILKSAQYSTCEPSSGHSLVEDTAKSDCSKEKLEEKKKLKLNLELKRSAKG